MLEIRKTAVSFDDRDMVELERLVNSLQKLNERAIPKVRGKAIYKALLAR